MESVRMGELVVSGEKGQEIAAIGLGSCIGLVLIDRSAGVGGMAHIVLPESKGMPGPAAKFADTCVPEMIDRMLRAGAGKTRLEAALVGGARMFSVGAGLDVGARNQAAVREALRARRIPIKATATGGSRGRTARFTVGDWTLQVQEAGGERFQLLGGTASARVAARHSAVSQGVSR
jgi:chemotaxis protein CheD